MKNKIHVFCEKPPGRNIEDIKSVIKQEKLNKRSNLSMVLIIGIMGQSKAKKIIDGKTLGKILNIRGVYGKSKIVTFGKNEWRSSNKKSWWWYIVGSRYSFA